MFFKVAKKSSYSISCVVTDTQVSIVVFENSHSVPLIIFKTTEEHSVNKDLTLSKFTKECHALFRKALSSVYSAGYIAPSNVYIAFSSAWSVSQNRTAVLKRNKKFTITKELVNDLKKKELKILRNDGFSQYIANNEDLVLIEDIAVRTAINGYDIENPIGKTAKEFEVSFFFTLAPKKFTESITEIAQSVFNEEQEIHVHSLTFCQCEAVRYTSLSSNVLVVSIENEITHAKVLKDYMLSIARSFPIGKQNILRSLRKIQNYNEQEVSSYIQLYKTNHLHDEEQKEFHLNINNASANFRNKFIDTVTQISKKEHIPKACMIIADSEFAWIIADTLSHIEKKLRTKIMTNDMIPVGYKKDIEEPDIFDVISVFCVNSI